MPSLARAVSYFDRKLAALPFQRTARALKELKGHNIVITLSGLPVTAKSRLGLAYSAWQANRSAQESPLNGRLIASNVRAASNSVYLNELRFLGLDSIDISAPVETVSRSSKDLYGALRSTLHEPNIDHRLHEDEIGKFFQLAGTAKTPEQKNYIIKVLFDIVAQHDHSTAIHMSETCKWAVAIAKEMGLSKEELSQIEISAMLHDIGKLGLKKDWLDKSELYTQDDKIRQHMHPTLGADLLSRIPWMDPAVINNVLYHHSNNGYPEQLDFSKTPLGAKILEVADTVDAMTGGRIYQGKKPLWTVISELRDPSFHYHQEAVDAFVRVLLKYPISKALPLGISYFTYLLSRQSKKTLSR